MAKVKLPSNVDKDSFFNDRAFFEAAMIKDYGEMVGKEQSLVALRQTFKNIKKAE